MPEKAVVGLGRSAAITMRHSALIAQEVAHVVRQNELHGSGSSTSRSSPAHEQPILLDTPVVVVELVALLGANLVAYLGGVRETRTLRGWAEGSATVQRPIDERRLQLAHQIGRLIGEQDSRGVVQAWSGAEPAARRLVTGPLVLAAARAFAASG
jgi:hypothetical protein